MFNRIFVVTLCLTSVALGQTSSSNGGRANIIVMTSVSGTNASAEANSQASFRAAEKREFRLLATNKTSTMEKEMNEAANAGFRFEGTMGGETSFGGSEVVVSGDRRVVDGAGLLWSEDVFVDDMLGAHQNGSSTAAA